MTPPSRGATTAEVEAFSYILPIRSNSIVSGLDDLDEYLKRIGDCCELIIVDGSPPHVFAAHHDAWSRYGMHVRPDAGRVTPMGKVGGVLTGVARASHSRVVLADDDVRFGPELTRLVSLLDEATVVRPQNYFWPLPWHAAWDSSRALLNRLTGGDWPGTLALQRDALIDAGGYAGDVMFENFELVQTLTAAGGTELVAYDLYVRRLPPTVSRFLSQRVRQAYDELSRPSRLLPSLAILPMAVVAFLRGRWQRLAWQATTISLAAIAGAEMGRRKAGARRYFPMRCSLLAPLWVCERALCSWAALIAWTRGGVRYGDVRLRKASTIR